MATPYAAEVRIAKPDAARPLAVALHQILLDDLRISAEVAVTEGDAPDLLVTMVIHADDASLAQVAAQERVREALRKTGLDADRVNLNDVAIRANS